MVLLATLQEILPPILMSNFFAHPSGISRTPITGVIEEINFFENDSPFLIKTTFFDIYKNYIQWNFCVMHPNFTIFGFL